MGTFVRPFPYPPSYTSRINHPPSTPTPAYSVNICCSLLSSCGVVKELLLVVVACICLYVTMRCTWFVCVHVYDNPEVQQLFQPKTVLFFLSPRSDILYTITCFTKWWTSPRLCLWTTKPLFSKGLQDDQSQRVAGIRIKIRLHMER